MTSSMVPVGLPGGLNIKQSKWRVLHVSIFYSNLNNIFMKNNFKKISSFSFSRILNSYC